VATRGEARDGRAGGWGGEGGWRGELWRAGLGEY
jgi:hypothetical protein